MKRRSLSPGAVSPELPPDLAMLLAFIVGVVAVMAVVVPSGQEVLRLLLPVLTFVLGCYVPWPARR